MTLHVHELHVMKFNWGHVLRDDENRSRVRYNVTSRDNRNLERRNLEFGPDSK